jgi:hypothetical protein
MRLSNFTSILFFISFLIFMPNGSAQTHLTIVGSVYDKDSGDNLSFASINLKNKFKGTVANSAGGFSFTIPKEHLKDTLEISFIGYEKKEILIDTISQSLSVELLTSNYTISEVVLTPLQPEDYIKLAVKNMPVNFPKSSYVTEAYFSNEITVNKEKLSHEESFFNSYHHSKNDSIDHQLILHKKNEINQEEMAIFYEETSIDLGGQFNSPDFILERGKTNTNEQDIFLDSLNFKRFEYRFSPKETPGYHTILFKSIKRIFHMELSGVILIERGSYAIASINYEAFIKIPLKIRPLLFLYGYGIEDPKVKSNRSYRKINEVWYLDFIEIEAYIEVEKKKLFKPNKQFNAMFYQIFNVNNTLIENIQPLTKEKIFDAAKNFESQIYNDHKLKWREINTLKH